MKIRYYLLALIIPVLFGGCNDTDDVTGIFLGKTWKLTNIFLDKSDPYPSDYWGGDEEAKLRSYELLSQAGKFIIRFDGVEADGTISGNFTGYATSTNVKGTWEADGKKNSFNTYELENTVDNDKLGEAFINGLKSATKYSGDYTQLSIYFREGGTKKYLLFRVED